MSEKLFLDSKLDNTHAFDLVNTTALLVERHEMPDAGGTNQEPKHVSFFGSASAALVVVGSIGFVFGMLYILYVQLDAIETSARVSPIDQFVSSKIEPITVQSNLELLGQLYMESDAQLLRTERAQSLVAARLTVMIIAELIGLCLVVLGAAFIFARIRGYSSFSTDKNNSRDINSGSQSPSSFFSRNYSFVSDFPGLFMCGFGTIVVIWALNVSVDDNARIYTGDRPLFFPSASYGSTSVGLSASQIEANAVDLGAAACREFAPDPSLCPNENN